MSSIRTLDVLALAACIAIASTAYAQGDASQGATGTATSTSASISSTTKAQKKADRKLGRAVRHAFSKAQGLDASNIYVRVRGGAIALNGTVPASAQIAQAEQLARNTPGVTSVTNRLTVDAQRGN